MKSKIFISYSQKDRTVADNITLALDKAGFAAWIDRREIKPGSSFIEKMNEGLELASYVLVLLSQNSVKSRWITREWTAAMTDEATVIIPVRLDDSPIPKLLSSIICFDLRDNRQSGVKGIVEFFKKETGSPARRVNRGVATDHVDRGGPILLDGTSRRQLRLVASRCIDNLALKKYCFDEEIELDDLGGESVSERILSLLHRIAKEGSLPNFAEWLSEFKKPCVEKQIQVLERQGLWQ
jgi:hypothetical protein